MQPTMCQKCGERKATKRSERGGPYVWCDKCRPLGHSERFVDGGGPDAAAQTRAARAKEMARRARLGLPLFD